MEVTVGTEFSASLVDPAGDIEGLGARVELPVSRGIVSYWREATLAGSVWSVSLDSPPAAGDYQLVWMTGDEPPSYGPVFIPLTAVGYATGSLAVVDYPPVDTGEVRPTVDDVAQLTRTRTVDGSSDDEKTYNENTIPSDEDVEHLIDQAIDDVMAQLPVPEFDPRHYPIVRRAVTIQTAILIELSYHREQTDDKAVDLLQSMLTTALNGVNGRIDRDLKQNNLIGGLLPRNLA